MKREERKTLCTIIAAIGIGIILGVYFYTLPVNAEKASYTDDSIPDGNFIEETSKEPEKGLFDENSAMPCCVPDYFRSWLETYEEENDEQETSEETRSDDGRADHEEAGTSEDPQTEPAPTVETAGPPLYRIAGQEIDASLQIKLYQHLQAAGIPWWYEIGLCQIFQESSGNVYAVSKDGRDMGILQFRAQFWDWNRGDIFNADAQMQLYSEQMAARLNSGLSADECISRHKTSDYSAAVDWAYVQQVKQHLPSLEALR